jgi:hypothetical protein
MFFRSPNTINFPPLTVDLKTRENKKWKEAALDALENAGAYFYEENLARFQDFYEMFDGTLSHTELKELAPQYEELSNLLDDAEIPTNVRHWDRLGRIINSLVGKLLDFQDKFHVTEAGAVAENDFLEHKNEQLRDLFKESIDAKVKIGLAKRGLTEDGRQFESEEEQKQYIAQLEQTKKELISERLNTLSKSATFKTSGIEWAESVLDRDKMTLNFEEMYQELFKHFLLTGVAGKITKTYFDTYKTFVWDSREIFHSRDIGKKHLEDFEYAGRFHFKTPSDAVKEYGHLMSEKQQKSLLGGDTTWKSVMDSKYDSVSPLQAMNSNFHTKEWTPYAGYRNAKFMERLEDSTGLPMGVGYRQANDGSWDTFDRFIPRGRQNLNYVYSAGNIERRFDVRTDLCQITEAYVKVKERIGWLTYEDEMGVPTTEMVTEDILPEFLREYEIKQVTTVSAEQMKKDMKPNTLVWQLRDVVYEGVKIQSGNLEAPLYLKFEAMPFQIVGISNYESKLPLTGIVSNSIASKLRPFQEMFNYCMNGIRNLIEKELGMFFLMDIANIPSEYKENGTTEEAIMNMRNAAKQTGFVTMQTSPDNLTNQSVFNQFSTQNLSHSQEIQTRLAIADRMEIEMYKMIGINPQVETTPQKYTTAEGVKVSNESIANQVAYIFNEFNSFVKEDQIQHLNIAHWMQSNDMDKSIYYTSTDNTQKFLRVTQDDKFSLRKFGLIVTDDSRKRKEFEQLRSYLMSQNTMGTDIMELGRILSTDSYSELLQVAKEERELKEQREQLKQQRDMELNQQATALADQKAQKDWERQEITNQRNRDAEYEQARMTALGRASDKDASKESFDVILKTQEQERKNSETQNKYELENRKLDAKEKELLDRKEQSAEALNLKLKELALREKDIEVKKEVAYVNKN